jgi:hypothetical protein
VLIILQRGVAISPFLHGLKILRRPALPIQEPEPLLAEIDAWLAGQAAVLAPRFVEEPERLLKLREFRATVVASVTLLETALRDRLERQPGGIRPSMTMGRLAEGARYAEFVTREEAKDIETWRRLRNSVVHTSAVVSAKTARGVVTGVLRLVRRLRDEQADQPLLAK